MSDNGFPRASRMDLWSEAERAIQHAVDVCETTLPASPLETEAIILLGNARATVAHLVDREIRAGRMPMPSPADSPLPASGDIPSQVSQADIDWIEEEVGMGAGAWDMVAPYKIIAACWARLRAARATPPKGAEEPERCDFVTAFGQCVMERGHASMHNGAWDHRVMGTPMLAKAVVRPTREEPNGE